MNDHPDLGTLAELADGSLHPRAALDVIRHLSECHECTEAYSEAIRYRAAWLSLLKSPDPRREAMGEVASLRRAAARDAHRPAISRRRIAGALAGSLALVACAVLACRLVWTPTLGFGLPPAVRAATEGASARGLVLPGGERLANATLPAIRSGLPEVTSALEREVDSLTTAYEHSSPSAGLAARVVTALLAANDVSAAGDYARESVRRRPNDVRLLVLSAATAYRRSDLDAAESSLRAAARLAPADPIVALDLALVLRQRGRPAEARRLLEQVARGPHAELAARAKRELNAR